MTNLGFDDHGIKFDGWKHIPGVLKNVSVGPLGGVFGCNPKDEIFYLNGTKWQRLAGALKCISVGKVTLFYPQYNFPFM